MGRQLPKNVRQIGNVSDNPKVYVEDYVDTFFNQLCDKVDNMPLGAFLIGEMDKQEDQEYMFIFGAIQIHDVELKGNDIVIGDDAWKTAYEECKQYFESGEIIGWFATVPGMPMGANDRLVKVHERAFSKKSSLFIMKDPTERDELYYAYKFNDLMDLGGHYIYYEKNPSMQNYMISTRRQNGVTPSEAVEDRAAKNFRSLIRTRGKENDLKASNKFSYVASALLILLVVIIGVTTINNYDKMRSVQTSLENITESVTKKQSPKTTVEESAVQENEKATDTEVKDTPVSSDNVENQVVEGGDEPDAPDALQEANVPETSGETEEGIYVVVKGDTLARISKKAYGDTTHVDAICRMNGLTDGNLIYIGQKLLLP